MPLPAFVLNNLVPVGALAPRRRPRRPTGGATKRAGVPARKRAGSLAFAMQKQQQTNWCWAAVSASVARFYRPATPWARQCRVASRELGQTCCPAGARPGVCNVPWYLERALARVKHLQHWANGTATLPQSQGEISTGRPLGARVGWAAGGGHFVVLSGFSTAGNLVTVDDPIYGRSTLPLATFQSSYQGSGTWAHTYWTRP